MIAYNACYLCYVIVNITQIMNTLFLNFDALKCDNKFQLHFKANMVLEFKVEVERIKYLNVPELRSTFISTILLFFCVCQVGYCYVLFC